MNKHPDSGGNYSRRQTVYNNYNDDSDIGIDEKQLDKACEDFQKSNINSKLSLDEFKAAYYETEPEQKHKPETSRKLTKVEELTMVALEPLSAIYAPQKTETHPVTNNEHTIIEIMKILQSKNWKWMQLANIDDNIPITVVLREDNIPISILKEAYYALNNKEKQKTFIDSIKKNKYAMAIIYNYIENQQRLKLRDDKLQTSEQENRISKTNRINVADSLIFQAYCKQKITHSSTNNKKPKPKSTQPVNIAESSFQRSSARDLHNIPDKKANNKQFNKFEIVYSAVVESLSIGDLITDIIVLDQLIEGKHQWWTSFMLLFMLAPYLVSFCSLGSIFQSREKDIGNFFSLFLITPLCILVLILLDAIFMAFVVLNLLLLIIYIITYPCCKKDVIVQCIDQDKILIWLTKMKHMDLKGYRRLRTLSQLVFETIPQTLLQARMIWVLQYQETGFVDFGEILKIDIKPLAISIAMAGTHFIFELIMLWIESRAAKVTPFQYGITCLNARLNWVPLLNVIFRETDHHKSQQHKINWDNLDSQICKGKYRVEFEFSEGSFRRLYTQITQIQRFTDGSKTETKPLQTLLQAKYIEDIAIVQLGKNCCKYVCLKEFSRLYRNSDNRIMLDGTQIDWDKKVAKATDQIKRHKTPNYIDDYLFSDFMRHAEVDALYAIWNGEHVDKERINILTLKKRTLTNDITDIWTMKRFWKHRYCFGNSCLECHIIYDRIVKYYDAMLRLQNREKEETMDEMNKYKNMIISMLFFTRSTIINHKCPQCNITYRQYIINKMISEYGSKSNNPYTIDVIEELPPYIRVQFADSIFDFKINIPFIVAECSDIFSEAIGESIMSENEKIEESLFKQNEEPLEETKWEYIADDGTRAEYDKQLTVEINKQFESKYEEMKNKEKECEEEQIPMKYEDRIITIDLNVGPFFEENKDKYKIIINYHHVPIKYTQVNMKNKYERIVRRLPKNAALHVIISNKTNQNEANEQTFVPSEKFISILSSIIEYDVDAPQSFAIIKHHYDCDLHSKQQNTTIKEIIKLAGKLKLRNGYDKLLVAVERFCKKKQLILIPEPSSSDYASSAKYPSHKICANVSDTNIGSKIVGIKTVKIKGIVEMHKSKQEKISADTDEIEQEMDDYNPNLTTELHLNQYDLFSPPASPPNGPENPSMYEKSIGNNDGEIVCGLWLKIPIDEDKRQIDSWNDILLKTTIDLTQLSVFIRKKQKQETIIEIPIELTVNIVKNFSSIGSWNPSLYFTENDKKILEFEIKQMDDNDNTNNEYECKNIQIKYAKIEIITDEEQEDHIIQRIEKQFWMKNKAHQWQYKNDKDKFVNYDEDANKQIERDYKYLNKLNESNKSIIISITQGKWANKQENKNKYEIRIVRSQQLEYCYQINIETGTKRDVRRDAIDWNVKPTVIKGFRNKMKEKREYDNKEDEKEEHILPQAVSDSEEEKQKEQRSYLIGVTTPPVDDVTNNSEEEHEEVETNIK